MEVNTERMREREKEREKENTTQPSFSFFPPSFPPLETEMLKR